MDADDRSADKGSARRLDGGEFGKRVRDARKWRGLRQSDVGARAGYKSEQSMISKIEAGLNTPSLAKLIELAPVLGVSADYLAGLTETKEALSVDFIPIYPESAAAGEGAAGVVIPDVDVPHCFSRTRLERSGIAIDDAAVYQIAGDSMAPTLVDGSRVIVCKGSVAPWPKAIFVIEVDGRLLLKRFVRRGSAGWWVSDNPDFGEFRHRASVKVIGRVRWAMRQFTDQS